MMRIQIVTDSTSDLPKDLAAQQGIEIIPLKVMFGEQTYLDGVDISIDSFYEKLQASTQFPTTSQPSPAEFLAVYQRLLADPDVQILSVHLSSNLSGTHQSALLAKSELTAEQAARVTIIDSKYVCYGLGVIVLELAKAAAGGATIAHLQQRFEQLRNNISMYFVVDTLEFLQRGGRIGKASAFIGSLLNIKPILSIDQEGTVTPVERVRGQKQAVKKILELCKADFADREVNVTVLHSKAAEIAVQISAEIRTQFTVKHLQYASIGPVVGAHVGPGSVAVLMYLD